MAPPTRQNPERNEGNQANPPQPPPPPEAWQALMTATNANAQILIQLLQDRNQGQGNQGNQGQGNNQQNFATLNQFLANQPKTFSYCVEATDADDWLVDINKHFECSNVRPEDFVKFAPFQLKNQAAEWFQQYKDSRAGRVITWDEFALTSKPITFLKVLLRVSVRSSAISSKATCLCINTTLSSRSSLALLSRTSLMRKV